MRCKFTACTEQSRSKPVEVVALPAPCKKISVYRMWIMWVGGGIHPVFIEKSEKK